MAADEAAVLEPPEPVLAIASRLEGAGYETWCVGGAVRDALLGHPHTDWDLATAATPDEVMRLFKRTVPVGVAHGTVAVLKRGASYEVTTFRRDVRTDGRHAEVEFGATLDEDLARRDFTINAIAYSPSRRVLHDPFGGRADLGARTVRAVGRPADRMREDRLRALRAIRFASRFEFAIDPATWSAIVESAPALTRLSAERVREELVKTMDQVEKPARAIRLWIESGAMAVLIPPLADLDAITVASLDWLPRPREAAAGRAELVARAEARRLIRVAALFAGRDPESARGALRALRSSNAEIERVGNIAAAWQRVAGPIEAALLLDEPISDAAVRAWTAAAGRFRIQPVIRIMAARWCAAAAQGARTPDPGRVRALYRRVSRSVYRDALDVSQLQLTGNDLAALGVPQGPATGTVLRSLVDAVIVDPELNTRERLMELVRRWVAQGGPAGAPGEIKRNS